MAVYIWFTDYLVYYGISLSSTSPLPLGKNFSSPRRRRLELELRAFRPRRAATISFRALLSRQIRKEKNLSGCALTDGVRSVASLPPVQWLVVKVQASLDISPHYLYLIPWLIAKFGMASSFIVLFVYTSELFPLPVRSICMGACSTVSNLGCLLAPLLPHVV